MFASQTEMTLLVIKIYSQEETQHSEEEQQPEKLIIPQEINYGEAIGGGFGYPETFTGHIAS